MGFYITENDVKAFLRSIDKNHNNKIDATLTYETTETSGERGEKKKSVKNYSEASVFNKWWDSNESNMDQEAIMYCQDVGYFIAQGQDYDLDI